MESNRRVNARTAKLDTEALRKHDEQVRPRQFANRSSVDVETAIRAQIYLKYSQNPLLAVSSRVPMSASGRLQPFVTGNNRPSTHYVVR